MKYLITLIALLFTTASFAQDFFNEADAFFKKYVEPGVGLVDYAKIKQKPAALNALVSQIENASEYEGDREKAFLINAYNILVIEGVVNHYPVEGPMAIDGFFDNETFTLRGRSVSLNELEKEILMKEFPDARIHFALVCAAISCPKLPAHAFFPENLDRQLEKQTRKAINDPSFVKLNGNRAQLPKVFQWYADDFGGKDQLIPFVQKYLLKKVKLSPEYSFYEYSWVLNEQL